MPVTKETAPEGYRRMAAFGTDGLLGERENHRPFVVGRLRPDLSMEEANAQLARLGAQLADTSC